MNFSFTYYMLWVRRRHLLQRKWRHGPEVNRKWTIGFGWASSILFHIIPYQENSCKIDALQFELNFGRRFAELFPISFFYFFYVWNENLFFANMTFPETLNDWTTLKREKRMVSRLSKRPATLNLGYSSENSDFFNFCPHRIIRNTKWRTTDDVTSISEGSA